MSVLEKVRSYAGVYGDEDIRSFLHDDHEKLKALTKLMASDEPKQKRTAAFETLKPFLTAHARAEELAVYNALIAVRGSKDSRAAANEGFVEHSLVDVLLERLGKTELAGTDAWKAHAKVLNEMLEHHIKEEEREMFEELGEHFSDEQRAAMGADFEAKKLKVARRLPS